MSIGERGQWLEEHPDWALWDEAIALFLAGLFQGQSVIDLGCGLGHYLKVWRQCGVACHGVDGSPLVADLGLGCEVRDLTEPHIGRIYDWAVCLEVGEHVPADYAEPLLDNIAGAASMGVVLSWAVPGQRGHGHVNCQSNDWVIAQMRHRGYEFHESLTASLRSLAILPYFRDTLMVFER